MAAPHKADPAWQEHLDFLFPRAPMLRPDHVATGCGIDLATVRRLFDRPAADQPPRLQGITLNAAGGERETRRILRDSAILLYAERANYTPDEFLARIVEVLAHRSPRELLLVQQRITELIRSKS